MGLVRRVTLYYVGLGAVVAIVYVVFPDFPGYVSNQLYTATGSTGFSGGPAPRLDADAAPALLISMLTAIILMIPVSWVYMGTRTREGFQQSVVQTVMLLPIAVAGVVVVVQNSVALAFSLAGIVAAVRFRTTLKNKLDALYIFVAIGVGLASGIGALAVASVLSAVFSYANIVLWLLNYGHDGGIREQRRLEARHERWVTREAVRNAAADDGGPPDMVDEDEFDPYVLSEYEDD